MLIEIVYYKDRRGHEPAAEWMPDPDNATILPSIDARLTKLHESGLLLLGTQMMRPIEPRGKKDATVQGFYEIRHVSQKWRLAIYHDIKKHCFVLIHGWRKKRQSEKQQIDKAYTMVYDYIESEAKNVSGS